jgi:hypothetical protein
MEKLEQEILYRTVFYRNTFHHDRRLGGERQPINRVGGCPPPLPRHKAYVFQRFLDDCRGPSHNHAGSCFAYDPMVLD